jgi:hypothetical protein
MTSIMCLPRHHSRVHRLENTGCFNSCPLCIYNNIEKISFKGNVIVICVMDDGSLISGGKLDGAFYIFDSQVSISSTLYARIFRTNVVSAAFSMYK